VEDRGKDNDGDGDARAFKSFAKGVFPERDDRR
jgi:hypothetical protein